MTALCLEQQTITIFIHRLLFPQKGRYRFEGHTEKDILSVGYATLYASRIICPRMDSFLVRIIDVIHLRASSAHSVKTHSIIKAFGRVDGKHGLCQFGMKLAKNRFTQPYRATGDDTRDHASDGITLLFHLLYQCHHPFRDLRIRATHQALFRQGEIQLVIILLQLNGTCL